MWTTVMAGWPMVPSRRPTMVVAAWEFTIFLLRAIIGVVDAKMVDCWLRSAAGRVVLLVVGVSSLLTPSSRHARRRSTTSLLASFMDDRALQEALQQAQERDIRQTAPDWLQSRESLPFDCTACGKCCQTQGDVYLSPAEVQAAADYLQISVDDFGQTYASHTLVADNRDSQPWLRLREKSDTPVAPEAKQSPSSSATSTTLGNHSSSCIFLEDDQKTCSIYPVRPVQCRTYPFWPNLMATPHAWNAECRARDDADETVSLPHWSAEEGGCEGMRPLMTAVGDGARLLVEDVASVPIREALQQLHEYQQAERQFPAKGQEEIIPPPLPP